MFEDVKVGDRVWSLRYGKGKIDGTYPRGILVKFNNNFEIHYLLDGRRDENDASPTLFWDEVKITPPPRPKRMVKKYVNLWWRYEEDKGGKRERKLETGNMYNTEKDAVYSGDGAVKVAVEVEIEEE